MQKCILISVVCSALFISGCALGTAEPDPVLLKIDELDARLDRFESVLSNQSLLNLQTDNQDLTTQIRELRNQIETLGYNQNSAIDRQKNQYLDLDNRLKAMEGRPTRSASLSNSDDGGDTNAGAASGSEREIYQAAFDLLKGAKYTEAASGFESYLQQYPNGQLSDNAFYWLGESYYITRKFKEALSAFETVTLSYPQSRKIADAWLKLGYTYYEMKNINKAKVALEKTMSTFPDSSAALLAKQRLDRISKEQG